VKFGGPDSTDPWRTVVGIVADVHHAGVAEQASPQLFMPYLQFSDDALPFVGRGPAIVARHRHDPAAAVPVLRREVRAVDPDLPLYDVRMLSELVAESVSHARFRAVLLAAFATIAVVLALVGVYGVIAFFVSQRTPEFGVRIALGARAADILRLVFARGAILVAVGLMLGVPGAFALTRFMRSLLYGVGEHDPVTFVAVPALLCVAATLATYLPARRATKVDPLTALRAE
jgi:putative ABC transport system permease protein